VDETAADAPAPSPEATAGRPSYPISSVDNALRLLLLFSERDEIRLSDAAAEVGVARSTAHRLLAMLQHHGLVAQESEYKAYVAGPRLVDIGLKVVNSLDMKEHVRPFLEALAAEVRETVHLAALEGRNVMFLDSVETDRAVRVGARTGTVVPAHLTAVGKALLSTLPSRRLRELYPEEALSGGTPNARRSHSELEEDLEEARTLGYSLSVGQSEEDVAALGAVVRDRLQVPRAAVGISVPLSRFDAAAQQAHARALQVCVDRIGASLS